MPFSLHWHLHCWCKSKGRLKKTASTLAHIKVVIPTVLLFTAFFTPHAHNEQSPWWSSTKTNCIKSQPLSTFKNYFPCDKMGSMHKAHLLHINVQLLPKGKVLVFVSWTRCFFSWNINFAWKDDWQTNSNYSDWGFWQIVPWKWTRWVCYLTDSVCFQIKIQILEKLSTTMNSTASQMLKDFADEICANTNKCDFFG